MEKEGGKNTNKQEKNGGKKITRNTETRFGRGFGKC